VDYLANLAFGRKITGRLAFQAAGGPEQIRVTTVLETGTFNFGRGQSMLPLTYERRRSGISCAFVRGLNRRFRRVFRREKQYFERSLRHQFTRFWSASVNGGDALIRTLLQPARLRSASTLGLLGANVERQLGRHAQVGFNYGLVKQK